MHRKQTKKTVLVAMFSAIAVILGYLLLSVPNVELVMVTVFIGGYLMGASYGMIIGTVSETIMTLTNPLGSAAPPLMIAQTLSMAIAGLAGGVIGRHHTRFENRVLRFFGFGFIGLTLTVLFDLLTTLSFAPLVAGWDLKKMIAVFQIGIPFYLAHWISNFLIFSNLVPIILKFFRSSRSFII